MCSCSNDSSSSSSSSSSGHDNVDSFPYLHLLQVSLLEVVRQHREHVCIDLPVFFCIRDLIYFDICTFSQAASSTFVRRCLSQNVKELLQWSLRVLKEI